ncbi:MAG: SRPBCC family protein [Ferruginibacter sp.]
MKNNITGQASITIDKPVSKVWEALTKPELIKKYFFGTDTHTDWKPGSPIRFTGEYQGKKYEDKGTILDVETNKFIKYNYWSSMSGIEDKPENYVNITYDLNELDGKTVLTIVQENIPDEKMKAHSEENWKKVLQGLKDMLEKKTTAKTQAMS